MKLGWLYAWTDLKYIKVGARGIDKGLVSKAKDQSATTSQRYGCWPAGFMGFINVVWRAQRFARVSIHSYRSGIPHLERNYLISKRSLAQGKEDSLATGVRIGFPGRFGKLMAPKDQRL